MTAGRYRPPSCMSTVCKIQRFCVRTRYNFTPLGAGLLLLAAATSATSALPCLLLLDLIFRDAEQAAHRVREPLQAAALFPVVGFRLLLRQSAPHRSGGVR